MSYRWLLILIVATSGCGSKVPGSGIDASGGPDAPTCTTCGTVCCSAAELCSVDHCVPRPACAGNNDCSSDAFCDPIYQVCMPYGTGIIDDSCTQLAIVGVFAPDIQCEWLGPPAGDAYPGHANVLGTPMVVDFDVDANPETMEPSIVFVSYNGTDGGSDACVGNSTYHGVIRVIEGSSCAQQFSIAAPAVVASAPLAVGDLDGDGRAEIVGHRIGGGLVSFRYDATAGTFLTYWETASTLGAGVCLWSGPSLYDLNNDGLPEVLMGGSVFNGTTGAVIDTSLGVRGYSSTGQIPVVADTAGDGSPELVTGDAMYSWDLTANAGAGGWVAAATGLGADGLVAIADFGTFGVDPGLDDRAVLDGIPEVAVISSGLARIRTLAGRVIHGPIQLLYFPPATNAGTGGPPTIADFDGDGRAEMAVAGRGGYNVFDPDCVGTPVVENCSSLRTDGILWAMPTQDLSSSVTGSAVFDFEGDGQAEVVYADECFSRVYDGKDGTILYSAYRTSCTWYENPVIADVDGDFNSEIVIPSNNNCSISCPSLDPQFDGLRCIDNSECPGTTTCAFDDPGDATGRCRCTDDLACGGSGYVCRDPIAGPSAAGQVCRAGHPGVDQQGVRVVRDALDRWVNSRPIWNQHAYSVTHVSDGGRVPSTSTWAQNWLVPGLNNFRQAIAGDPESGQSPDLTGRDGTYECFMGSVTLTTQVCNRGTEPVGAGIPVTFYVGDPAAGVVACTATTGAILIPGDCADVSCSWTTGPPAPDTIITIVADDDGTGTSTSTECHEGNNRGTLTGFDCISVE
jgi:hypothetical protein